MKQRYDFKAATPAPALDCSDLDELEREAATHHQPVGVIVRAIVAVVRELRAQRAERGRP